MKSRLYLNKLFYPESVYNTLKIITIKCAIFCKIILNIKINRIEKIADTVEPQVSIEMFSIAIHLYNI